MTLSQLEQIKRNAEYWREREFRQRELYIMTEDQELAEINRIYDDMFKWAEREINAFYGKYADAEGIDITEAKRRVAEVDIKEYERIAKQVVADKDFSDRANQAMRLYNATMKINRLELLKAQIGIKLVEGINEIDQHYEKIATQRATQELERMAGILGDTLTDTKTARTAKQIVNATFYNANFSERIWSHQDNLRSEIAIELQKGFIAGVGSREMARRLKEHAFDKSYRDALRLARTELRRIQTDVAKDAYERDGFTQYEYLAVNPSACPICRKMDGNIYEVKDMEAGLNAPPMHPNCHCTTAPHIDDAEYEAWLNYLEEGGTTEQWDTLTDAEKAEWLPKAEASTIKSVDDCTTPEQVAELMDSQGWFYKHPTVETKTDLTGCDLESAKSVFRSVQTVFDKLPMLKGQLNPVGGGEKRKRVYASCWFGLDGRGGVNLNRRFYSNYQKLKESYLASTKQGVRPAITYLDQVIEPESIIPSFHPVNTTAEAIVIHEFGHAVDDYMTNVLKLNGKDKTYSARIKRSVQSATGVKAGQMPEEVSVYATENPKEWFAECFAEWLNSPSPRKVSTEFGAQLERELNG